MKKYEILMLDQKEKWNEIVKSFKNYEVFYLAEYVEAFRNHGDGEPLLFYYDDKNNRAINVILKRDISESNQFEGKLEKNKYFDLISPYGYGGMIIEGNEYKKVNEQYVNWCKANSIVSEFIRFNLFIDYTKTYFGKIENIKRNVVRKINMNPEDMLMDFEHKVRKNLKKAEKNELKIEIDNTGEKLNAFLKIYYDTMERNNANETYYFKKGFFETLNKMKDNVAYFNVIYQDKVISTELVIYNKNNAYSYLGGTLSEYFELRPNDFLKYEIIKWAYNKKIKNFVLGGGYGNEDDGILRYKKSFAPNDGMMDFYVGKTIFDEEIYNKLVEIRKENIEINENEQFFPLYRI